MSEKTVAEAREAMDTAASDLANVPEMANSEKLCRAIESFIDAKLAASLSAKAEAGEPRTFDATLYGPGPGNAPSPERINAVASGLLKEPSGEAPEPRVPPSEHCGRLCHEGGRSYGCNRRRGHSGKCGTEQLSKREQPSLRKEGDADGSSARGNDRTNLPSHENGRTGGHGVDPPQPAQPQEQPAASGPGKPSGGAPSEGPDLDSVTRMIRRGVDAWCRDHNETYHMPHDAVKAAARRVMKLYEVHGDPEWNSELAALDAKGKP